MNWLKRRKRHRFCFFVVVAVLNISVEKQTLFYNSLSLTHSLSLSHSLSHTLSLSLSLSLYSCSRQSLKEKKVTVIGNIDEIIIRVIRKCSHTVWNEFFFYVLAMLTGAGFEPSTIERTRKNVVFYLCGFSFDSETFVNKNAFMRLPPTLKKSKWEEHFFLHRALWIFFS